MSYPRILPLMLLILLLSLVGKSYAACTAASGSASFGSVSSLALETTPQSVTVTNTFACTGLSALFQLAPNNLLNVTFLTSANASGNTPRLYNAISGTYVPYSICNNTTCSSNYNLGDTINWLSNVLAALLNSSTANLPLTLVTHSGVNVPAGVYTDTLTLGWNFSICTGVFPLCIYVTGAPTTTIAVTLIVLNDCNILSSPDVNFGSAGLPSQFNSVTSNVNVRCTLNANYGVTLTSNNSSNGNWRQMSSSGNSGSHYLQYQVRDANGDVITTNSQSFVGSGTAQSIPYTYVVNPNQTLQPAGTYTDTIIVTVSY